MAYCKDSIRSAWDDWYNWSYCKCEVESARVGVGGCRGSIVLLCVGTDVRGG